MGSSIRRRVIDLLARPFRAAGGVNRNVLHDLMRDVEGTVLELGPGNAPMIARLERIDAAHKYVLEFEGAIEKSRSLGYHCKSQDLGRDRWDFDDASFDLVVSNQVLEHIPRTDHVIREAVRVLKPGGRFLVSVPNPGGLVCIMMMLMTFNPPMSMVSDEYYGLGNPLSGRRFKRSVEFGTEGHGHLRLFTIRGMQDLLTVHGLEVVKSHGGTWGAPLVGRMLARVFPWYGLYTIVLARKPESLASSGP
ncbi:MAG: class I SAM-dependent methyltransferase [Planctomycetota bacterium]|nr:class I SAM-dependent methyltransferase [Planctomycetota bacterium]